MFTLLDFTFFFIIRSGTTQEGSQGLWDYPQPIPDASRDPKHHQTIICFVGVRDLESVLPGQGEFDVRIPEGYKWAKWTPNCKNLS